MAVNKLISNFLHNSGLNHFIRRLLWAMSICIASNATGGDTYLKSSVIENFYHCMNEIGVYLFSQSNETLSSVDLERNLLHCEVIKDLDKNRKNNNLIAINNARTEFLTLDNRLKKQCLALWQDSWDKSKIRQDWLENHKYEASKLTSLTAELLYRAEAEVNMTGIARAYRNSPEGKTEYDYKNGIYFFKAHQATFPCFNPFLNITFARMDNVAFFENRDFFERLFNKQIPQDAFWGLILIAKHADLDLTFQRKAAAQFKKAAETGLMSDKYYKQLEARLEHVSKNPN